MNGFFIIAEISGLQQLLEVDSGASGEMIKNCERSINNSLRAELKISGSLLVFSIASDLKASAEIIEASVNLLELISGYSEEIHEFSIMLIHRLNTDAEAVLPEFRQRLFCLSVDGSLLVENRIMRAADCPADDDTHGMFQLISIDSDESGKSGGSLSPDLIQKKDAERILKFIVPEIGDEADNKNIVLQGKSELLLRMHVNEAVRQACGKDRNTSAVYINILENETDIIRPFFRSIDEQMIPLIGDYLSGVELRTWLKGMQRLADINSDNPSEYFFSIYCLYLKGYVEYLKKALQPSVVVVTGLTEDRADFFDYLNRTLEYLPEENRPVVIFLETERGPAQEDSVRIRCCEDAETPSPLSGLSFHDKRLLHVLGLTEGLFERSQLDDFLLRLDYSHSEIQSGIRTLESAGAIIDGRYIRVLETVDDITEQEKIIRVFAGYLTEIMLSGDFSDYGRAARKLSGFIRIPEAAEAVFGCLMIMLDYGRTHFVLNYLSEYKGLDAERSDALEIRSFLLECDKGACLKVLKGRPESQEAPDSVQNALLQLEISRYYHAMNDYQRALDYVKKVLIFLQEGDYPRLEGIAFTELGFLMLCKGKLLESSEYLNLAVEKLTGSGDNFSLMKVYIYSAVQKYLWGAIDQSLADCENASSLVESSGFSEWYFYIEFFRCRLYFELGRYYDAEKVLASCLLQNELYRNDQRRKIFSAWTARACVYQGKIYRGMNMLLSLKEDPEILFFLSEAYYFNGNMEKAAESIERAEGSDEYFSLGFMPLEFINWKNGYTSVEGRALRSDKDTGVLFHNIRAMHAFLLGLTGNREYGTEILFSLTRDQKISDNDPFNRLYFYFYCQLLERRQNTEMIDKLTLISKALKYLQQTASRINTPKIRQEFMSRNYWNSLLVNEAQREKLI